jgi:DNA-binding GntR family transcriptional regulator
LVRQTGGSRFKIREALQRLAAEGLVDIEEFRGAQCATPRWTKCASSITHAGALEGICAADFTAGGEREQRVELLAIAEEMEVCVAGHAPQDFARLNARWHNLIMDGAGNGVIKGFVQRLNTPIHHLVFETFYRGERLRAAVQDHREILAAIRADDPELAERAMRDHVINGLEFLSQLDRSIHFGEADASPQ